ncbi:YihY/virulence factor BrkB family protein [Nocardioides mangrovicus]|uniref:YihY/virulence factor BrkB family protein n=1 Tax=Nocardioides mangrovicus TaxID=2478913 RepID=A0A3L8P895_9ACTN|nr:YihY/virulence factor BrkB family protein [Nocardioides mangrovicus]
MAYNELEERPAPEHPDKPSGPTKLEGVAIRQALSRTLAEFSADNCTGLAAGLTYYAVFAIFPALIALLSLLGVVGQADSSIKAVLDVMRPLVSDGFLTNQVRPFVENLATAQGAGIGLVVGIVLALLSASGYVAGFRQAMNTILEVEEGRPIWILRPLQFLVTLVAVVLIAGALVILVVSGSVADSIGSKIGVGDQTVLVWNIAKWPVLLVIVVLVVALLYYATPNVKQPHIRWVSVGAFVAIVIWLVASVGFAFYVANFGSYNKTYGSLAFVIVALLWIWITNVALLFGAELDSELERVRELQAGIAAEDQLQLPLRDDRQIKKAEAKHELLLERARDLRRAR